MPVFKFRNDNQYGFFANVTAISEGAAWVILDNLVKCGTPSILYPSGYKTAGDFTIIDANDQPIVYNKTLTEQLKIGFDYDKVDHEAEREVMIQAFDKVRLLFENRAWIMDGRGSYPYDDDRYREEVRNMYEEFEAIKSDTWSNISTKTADYRKKIIEDYHKENLHSLQEKLYEALPARCQDGNNIFGDVSKCKNMQTLACVCKNCCNYKLSINV